jgi:hypothetical protein
MTTQPDYSKIYTHAPEQHPNLILGSLQLFFWVFFRPTAFKNHLKRIHPILDGDTSLITVLQKESDILKNLALWKFILQGFVILPALLTVLTRVMVILFLVASGMPLQQAISVFLLDLFYRVAVGMALSVPIGVAYGVPFGVAEGMAYGVATGVALGVAFGVAYGVAGNVAVGVAFGLVFSVGATIHSWRPPIFHSLLVTWNFGSCVLSVLKC